MGGLFEVESVPGHGTVVTVEVPNSPATTRAVRPHGWLRLPATQHPEGEPAAGLNAFRKTEVREAAGSTASVPRTS
jgi:hypothetical protein